jgi:hypothetical protein
MVEYGTLFSEVNGWGSINDVEEGIKTKRKVVEMRTAGFDNLVKEAFTLLIQFDICLAKGADA